MPQKPQGAVIVGYLIGYDSTTTHVKMQKSLATVATSIVVCTQYFSYAFGVSEGVGRQQEDFCDSESTWQEYIHC